MVDDDQAVPSHLCGWVVLRRADQKVLLARRSGVTYGVGLWGLPGGHAQIDESWRSAAARETMEEIGVLVAPDKLEVLGIGRYLDDGLHGVDAFFLATEWEGDPAPVSECSEVAWFDPANLPADALPWLPNALSHHLLAGDWLHEDV